MKTFRKALLSLFATLGILLLCGIYIYRVTPPADATLAYDEANKLLESGKSQDARRALPLLNHAIELAPNYADAHVSRSYALSLMGDHKGSVEAATRALEINGNDVQALINRGLAELHLKHPEKALADFDRVVQLDSSNVWGHINRGYVHYELKQYEQASKDYEAALKINPQNVDVSLAYGRTLSAQSKFAESIPYFREAIHNLQGAKQAFAYEGRAIMWSRQNKWEKAISDYSKAISLNPKNACFYYSRGLCLKRFGKDKAAVNDYTKAIALDPKYADAYGDRGIAWKNLKKYDESLADFNVAIRLEPKEDRHYLNRGITYRHMRKFKEALSDLDKALKLDPDDYKSYYAKGQVFMMRKEWIRAIPCFEKALAHKDNQSPSPRADILRIQAWCYYRNNQPAKSETNLNETIQGKYDDSAKSNAYSYRGLIRIRQGREAEAQKDFLEARKYCRKAHPKDEPRRWKNFQKFIAKARKLGRWPSATRQPAKRHNLQFR